MSENECSNHFMSPATAIPQQLPLCREALNFVRVAARTATAEELVEVAIELRHTLTAVSLVFAAKLQAIAESPK